MSSALREAGALRRTARAYVGNCFREETQPQVNELAALLAVRPYELSRLFMHATGEPLSSYLERMQIGRARRLLRSTDLPLNQVAYASGFGTRASFFRMFKKVCGCTPQESLDELEESRLAVHRYGLPCNTGRPAPYSPSQWKRSASHPTPSARTSCAAFSPSSA